MEKKSVVFETEDLALASYLKMKGIELKTYRQSNEGRNKVMFSFIDTNEECDKLHIEFLNSECKKFDSEIRDLKKLLRR